MNFTLWLGDKWINNLCNTQICRLWLSSAAKYDVSYKNKPCIMLHTLFCRFHCLQFKVTLESIFSFRFPSLSYCKHCFLKCGRSKHRGELIHFSYHTKFIHLQLDRLICSTVVLPFLISFKCQSGWVFACPFSFECSS